MIRKFTKLNNVDKIQGSEQFKNLLKIISGDLKENETSALFLGPKAENMELLSELITEILASINQGRHNFHTEDPVMITDDVKSSETYLKTSETVRKNLNHLLKFMNKYDTPFYSSRYQGHMNWELAIPAITGYFAAMLHNPNNVTVQASTATTFLEMAVGRDICNMIGYDNNSWAHITCDGSVANLEALWAAREVKLLPVSIKEAIFSEKNLNQAKELKIQTVNGTLKTISEITIRELLNVSRETALSMPKAVSEICGLEEETVWEIINHKYSCNAIGFALYSRKYLKGHRLILAVPSTRHYSWDKAAAVLGFGCIPSTADKPDTDFVNIMVDQNSRQSMTEFSAFLDFCSNPTNKALPVLAVGVTGSTEEAAVDPLSEMLEKRNFYRANYNLDVPLHADAAYGGYTLSTIREDFSMTWPFDKKNNPQFTKNKNFINLLPEYTVSQLNKVSGFDSVTIDPHKWGYIPYGAGSLSYKDGRIINCTTFGAPYIGGTDSLPSIGDFGIEGSKPGASPTAVFLNHTVTRPSKSGYGKIINDSVLSSKLFYLNLLELCNNQSNFILQPLTPLSAKITELIKLKDSLEKTLSQGKEISTLSSQDLTLLQNLGPDMNMVDYAFNFFNIKNNKKMLNTDWNLMNKYNKAIYDLLHIHEKYPTGNPDLIVTMTTFEAANYGSDFITGFSKRLGIKSSNLPENINCLRSTIMDPWLTIHNTDGSNFLKDIIMPALKTAAEQALAEINCQEEFIAL
jgi:glutamate/tyrosine decarboxylase-like PLP-dependent enzyme